MGGQCGIVVLIVHGDIRHLEKLAKSMNLNIIVHGDIRHLENKVVYRDQYSKIQAYQKSIDQKLVHVVTSAPRLTESGEKVFTQVKLTQKLITRIAKWLEKGVAA